MTPQQFVGLAARLFAIWLAISSLQAIAIGQALQVPGSKAPVVVPYAIAAIYIAAAGLLWFFPMVVAHRLVPRTHADNKLQVNARDAVTVACVAVGLMLIALKGLAPVAAYLSIAAHWIGNGQSLSTLEADRHIDGFVGIIQVGVGVALATRSRSLAAYLLPANHQSSESSAP